jgi:hypothetical protein
MSTTTPQAPVAAPDLTTLFDMRLRDALQNTNCHLLGTIESFDAAKQTATVSINQKLNFAGVLKDYPPLVEVPVFILGGGNRVFTFPVRQGDTCLVLFNDRDIDNWFTTGNITTPNSTRLHDLSDGLALVGFRSLANPVDNYSTTDVEVRNGESKIAVGELLLLANAATDLKTLMLAVITALTTLDSVKTGGSAAAAIALANTQVQTLLKTPT